MKVRPAPGPDGKPLQVRYENSRRVLAHEGADVPDTTYWHRRLMQGDVVAIDAPARTSPA